MAIDRRELLGLSAAGAGSTLLPSPSRATPMPLGSLGLDVTHFGVNPGSSDDQSQALQRAIDASAAARVPLWLPAGTYVASDLVLPSGAQLYGIRGATRLLLGYGASIAASAQADQVTLQGLIFDGNGQPLPEGRGLISLRQTRGMRIFDCTVQQSGGIGIRFETSEGEIAHNTIIGAAKGAIHALDGRGIVIANNTVLNCAHTGIQVRRSRAGDDGTQVLANRIENVVVQDGDTGQNGNGISVLLAANVIVADNRIRNCSGSAVRGESNWNLHVRGNTASALGGIGIHVVHGSEGAVISGNSVEGAATGISIANFNEGGRLSVCQGNLVRNLSRGKIEAGFGIGIAVEADAAVTGNVVEGAPLAGILVGWGQFQRDVTVTGNVVRAAPIGIGVSVAPGAGSALVAHNLIAGASTGAVMGMDRDKAITGDLARDLESRFAQLTVSGNRVR
ncbi:MAG: TIGR03808 family TAT-translocated repetitive protein [Xanthobacteraceae bacterium]